MCTLLFFERGNEMNNEKKAKRDALNLCMEAFGDRMYEDKRAVWMIVFDDMGRDHVCIMQRVPDEMGCNLQDVKTSARAVAAVRKDEDNAELLSFLCLRPEYSD